MKDGGRDLHRCDLIKATGILFLLPTMRTRSSDVFVIEVKDSSLSFTNSSSPFAILAVGLKSLEISI